VVSAGIGDLGHGDLRRLGSRRCDHPQWNVLLGGR